MEEIDYNLTTLKDFVNRVLDVVYHAPRSIIKIYHMLTRKPENSSDTYISDKGIVFKYYHNIDLVKIYSLDAAEYAKLTGNILEVLGGYEADLLNNTSLESIEHYYCKINLDDMVNKINEIKNYSDEELKLYFKLTS